MHVPYHGAERAAATEVFLMVVAAYAYLPHAKMAYYKAPAAFTCVTPHELMLLAPRCIELAVTDVLSSAANSRVGFEGLPFIYL